MPDEFDPTRTAVVNVHWQHEIVSPEGTFGPVFAEQVIRRRVASYAARIVAAARSRGALIVYTRTVHRPGYPDLIANTPNFAMITEHQAFLDGTRQAQIIDELAPEPEDVLIRQVRLSGFFGTELDTVLRGRGVETLLFTGVATNLAVANTVFDAINLGYRPVIVSDACTTATDQAHQAGLETLGMLCPVLDTEEVVRRLPG